MHAICDWFIYSMIPIHFVSFYCWWLVFIYYFEQQIELYDEKETDKFCVLRMVWITTLLNMTVYTPFREIEEEKKTVWTIDQGNK